MGLSSWKMRAPGIAKVMSYLSFFTKSQKRLLGALSISGQRQVPYFKPTF